MTFIYLPYAGVLCCAVLYLPYCAIHSTIRDDHTISYLSSMGTRLVLHEVLFVMFVMNVQLKYLGIDHLVVDWCFAYIPHNNRTVQIHGKEDKFPRL